MNKRSKEKQILRAGCSKAEPKFFPAADPLPWGTIRPKINQLQMVTTFHHHHHHHLFVHKNAA